MDFSWLVFLNYLQSNETSFSGDRKHLNDAKKHVQEFYKDLDVTLEDVPQRSVSIV
jgi:hypothetical protein